MTRLKLFLVIKMIGITILEQYYVDWRSFSNTFISSNVYKRGQLKNPGTLA